MAKKRHFNLSPSLGPTDIIPLVRRAWDLSFGRVLSNKKAIAERGWNPCNSALLCNNVVLRTKVEEDGSNGLDAARSESATGVASLPTAASIPTDLNTESGTAFNLLESLIDRQKNSEAAIEQRMKKDANGRVVKKQADKMKSLTSGKLFAMDKVALHTKDVIEHQKGVVMRKEQQEKDKATRVAARRSKTRKTVQQILEKKPNEDDLTKAELKKLLAYKKRPGDKAISRLETREEMLDTWKAWKSRESPPVSDEEGEIDDNEHEPAPPGTNTDVTDVAAV